MGGGVLAFTSSCIFSVCSSLKKCAFLMLLRQPERERSALSVNLNPYRGDRLEIREHESPNQRAYYLNDGLLYADLPLSGKPLLYNIVIIENVLYD